MTRLQVSKTSFTSGEIDPEMLGRIDLRAYEEGAAKLRNVLVKPTGGVSRRFGTAHVAMAPGTLRLAPFDTRDGERLVALGAPDILVWDRQSNVEAVFESPWRADQLGQTTWTHIDGGLLICHPDVEPRHLRRDLDGGWTLVVWQFAQLSGSHGTYSAEPFAKLVDSDVAIQPRNVNVASPDEADPIPAGADIEINATAPVFVDDHFGMVLRIKGRDVRIQTVESSVKVRAIALHELIDGKSTRFFEEPVYSDARGWPAAATQHQDRLVLAGSPKAADLIWFSKTGDYFNFDTGTGLDDEAISFRLSDSRLHQVRQMTGGRRLQVLTNLGEWIVSGSPLTPTNIQLDQQTNVGSPIDRQVRPLEVDGATVFAGASKRDIREFIFADTEQAFQAPDIALLSRHLIDGPRDLAFVLKQRLLAVVVDSGSVVTATLDRNANIVAWTLQDFGGSVLAATLFDDALHLLVRRGSSTRLEKLGEQSAFDAAVQQTSATPQALWTGFGHLVGQVIRVIADDVDLGQFLVTSDILDIGVAANSLLAGLAYQHEIEPLPVSGVGRVASLDTLYRPIRSVFRIHQSQSLRVETARGERTVLPGGVPSQPISGDFALRDFGWRRGQGQWPWRIRQSEPRAFTLLSATTEIKVNN